MKLHHFPYFDPTKKSTKKNIISFSGIPYWLRSIKKSAHEHNVFFGSGFGHRWNIGLINKNSKNEIILKLPHLLFALYHRIFNFSGTP